MDKASDTASCTSDYPRGLQTVFFESNAPTLSPADCAFFSDIDFGVSDDPDTCVDTGSGNNSINVRSTEMTSVKGSTWGEQEAVIMDEGSLVRPETSTPNESVMQIEPSRKRPASDIGPASGKRTRPLDAHLSRPTDCSAWPESAQSLSQRTLPENKHHCAQPAITVSKGTSHWAGATGMSSAGRHSRSTLAKEGTLVPSSTCSSLLLKEHQRGREGFHEDPSSSSVMPSLKDRLEVYRRQVANQVSTLKLSPAAQQLIEQHFCQHQNLLNQQRKELKVLCQSEQKETTCQVKLTSKKSHQPPTTKVVTRQRSVYVPADQHILTAYQILVRQNIEFFEALPEDVGTAKPGRKVILVAGQVGIRCIHCRKLQRHTRPAKATCYFPTKLSRLYHAAQTIAVTHLANTCPNIDQRVRDRLLSLQDVRQKAGVGKAYWASSARTLGVVETENEGLRF